MINQADWKFWIGVVEDNADPMMLGRVKVRVFGLHPNAKTPSQTNAYGIATADLPWAHVMLPTTSPAVSGFGSNPWLLQGSWVIGVSRDGDKHNELLVIGTLPGMVTTANPQNPQVAFAGNDGLYPNAEFVGEPDISRLARGVLAYHSAQFKSAISNIDGTLKTGIPIAGGGSWSELPTGYAAKYPHNRTFVTPANHTVEIDDTPGAERVLVYHGPSKSYVEILKDGTIQIKSTAKQYEITLSDRNMFVGGNLNITVNGNANLKVDGNAELDIGGNLTGNISGNATLTANEVDVTSNGNTNVDCSGSLNLTSSGETQMNAASVTATTATFNVLGSLQMNGQEVLTV